MENETNQHQSPANSKKRKSDSFLNFLHHIYTNLLDLHPLPPSPFVISTPIFFNLPHLAFSLFRSQHTKLNRNLNFRKFCYLALVSFWFKIFLLLLLLHIHILLQPSQSSSSSSLVALACVHSLLYICTALRV